MPSRFCLLPGPGTFPWPRAWLPGHSTDCATDEPPAASAPTPLSSQWSLWPGRGKTNGLCLLGKRLSLRNKENHRSPMLECVCVSTPCAKAGQLSLEAMARLRRVLPFTSHGPWGFQRAFPRNSHLGSFYLQPSVVMAQASFSAILSWVGSGALKSGPCLSPTMTSVRLTVLD